ncbi:MAG: transglycosylase domain-containing protein [Pontixanthobacter sp.]
MLGRFFKRASQSRRDSLHGDALGEREHSYFATQDAYGSGWHDGAEDDDDRNARQSDYDRWDRGLDQVDAAFTLERHDTRWFQPAHYQDRRKRWWLARIVAAMLLFLMIIVAWLAITAPLSKSLQPIAPPQITLLAADGTPIARNGAITADPIVVGDLPDHVVQSFLAIEDRRFYNHWGVDPRGIARAAWTGYGGGSTITQQLAKFTFLTPERSMSRKAREMLIAFWLEAWLTKEEILERYLSNAYFGDNVYGLRAASLHYFYRKPENLKPEQAAMLAGLVQAPSRYAPTRHFERAVERMALVKNALVAAGYMTQAEADAMPTPRVDSRTVYDLPTGTYFADWALPDARKRLEGGYASQTITTTLDSRLQNIAKNAVARAPLGEAQIALVAMRPSGEVVAMIGGKDYSQSPFNRATQAKRQSGSTFKLFTYLTALREGMEPTDLLDNTPIEAGSYRPKNAKERYSDQIGLQDALAQSSNVATVRLYKQLGHEAVIETARDLGVTAAIEPGDPSAALGTSTLTLLELTAAYAGVAGNSFPVEPHAFPAGEAGWFDWAIDRKGSLSRSDHEDMERMLRAVVTGGTGGAAALNTPTFGKTGTTQNNRDALFVGYAGEDEDRLVVGVWIGNDDNTPLNGISGGGLPARVWRDFMRQAIGERSAPAIPAPSDPSGPVQPMDIPDLGDIPLDENGSRLRIDEDTRGVTVETEIEGIPLDLRLDDNGVSINRGRREPQASDEPQN